MNIPNALTIFRILLVPVFVNVMIYYSPERDGLRWIGFSIFILAILTDGLDGFLARWRGSKTKLGSILDPIADKLLLASSVIVLTINKDMLINLPLWFAVVVISRDFLILFGSGLVFVLVGDLKIKPTVIGKCAMFMQTVSVLGTLLLLKVQILMPLWIATIAVTIVSGLDYMIKGSRMFNNAKT